MKPDSIHDKGRFGRIVSRALTAACAVALTVGLAGCGDGTAGTVTLDFFQYKAEAADWFTAKAREFEKTHPNITINVNNSSDATTDLRTRLVKNREPDVITINGDINYGMLAEAGVFHDFTDDEIVDELNPGMVKIAKSLVQTTDKSKKRLYAIPYAGNASGYIINVDVWEQAGEDPDNPPQTWNEFIALLKRFKAKGITPIEASTADPWTLQAPLSSLNSTLVPESEYTNLKNGSKKFSDLWTPVSEKLVEIYQNYTQKNPAVTYQQATQDLAAGKAAILPLGTYAIPQVRLVNKNANLRFAQMPATNNAKEQQLTAGDDVMLTIGAHTKHYNEARQFVDFLMSEKNVKDYSKQQSAFTPYKDTYVGDEALNGVLDF
ncbi:MAG TPA: ABC transporter substrate-binding protein, partial [Bifidobacterium sp.]|nr:ABC transporter substrate-binding protein [Bifidobacterium sp.]